MPETRRRWWIGLGALVVLSLGLIVIALASRGRAGHDIGPFNWALGFGAERRWSFGWLVAAWLLIAAAGFVWVKLRDVRHGRVLVVFTLGVGCQMLLALSEGHGLHRFHDRLWQSGHGEFVRIARDEDLTGIVSHYDDLAKRYHWVYPRSKPPGGLLVYKALVAVAKSPVGFVAAHVSGFAHEPLTLDDRITGTAFFAFILGSFAVVFPLRWFVSTVADGARADVAALLFATTPCATIVTMHLDNALFPLVAISSAALVAYGTKRRKPMFTALGGVLLSVGLFITFSLLPVLPIILAVPVAVLIGERPAWRELVRDVAIHAGAVLVAIVLVQAAIVVLAHYPIRFRFHEAMHFHANWGATKRNWNRGNPAEFLVYVGAPVAALALAAAVRPTRPLGLLAVVTAVSLIGTVYLGHERGETPRLWLFFVPFIAAAASRFFKRLESPAAVALGALVMLQVATTFMLHGHYEP